MSIQIYGIEIFKNITNWFTNFQTIILFSILTFVVCFFFYKINLTNKDSMLSGWFHYVFNLSIIFIYGIMLFNAGQYVTNTDVIYTMIFTILFYGVNITILTIGLIILRRWKIKRWIISKVDIFDKLTKEKKQKIKTLCDDNDHQYLDMFRLDIYKEKIDKNKYYNINVWENKNRKREE